MPDMLLCTSVEWCQPTQALARDGVRQAGARDDVRQAGARDGVRQAVKRLGQHKSSLTRNSAVSGMSFRWINHTIIINNMGMVEEAVK